jgi:hypothetical protein
MASHWWMMTPVVETVTLGSGAWHLLQAPSFARSPYLQNGTLASTFAGYWDNSHTDSKWSAPVQGTHDEEINKGITTTKYPKCEESNRTWVTFEEIPCSPKGSETSLKLFSRGWPVQSRALFLYVHMYLHMCIYNLEEKKDRDSKVITAGVQAWGINISLQMETKCR